MIQELTNALSDKWKRLNTLYWIKDKDGKRIRFRCNAVQTNLFEHLHTRNIVLKSRKHGITTFACVYFFDESFFNSNIQVLVNAHKKDDARDIFRDKINFPHENMPAELRDVNKIRSKTKLQIEFKNGSVISVSTSGRSSTPQYVLISELGYTATKFPEKAKEIQTGTLEAITEDNLVIIESTAKGKGGLFYDICQEAEKKKKRGKQLTKLDYKLHFFPWYNKKDNISDEPVPINQRLKDYFKKIEAEAGIKLSDKQKYWYTQKESDLGEDIWQEHPSTPEEAFKFSVQGAFFASQFVDIYKEGRICSVPHKRGVKVDTWWDLGMDDSTTIWFTQDIGREIHVIDYYENSGEGFEFYSKVLSEKSKERNFVYGTHTAPHDITVREIGPGKSRFVSAKEAGIDFEKVNKTKEKMLAIDAARSFLSICWFDEIACGQGIEGLENYKKKWDEHNGVFLKVPVHNAASHSADAFMTLSTGHKLGASQKRIKQQINKSKSWVYV